MEVQAISKYERISALKLRDLARQLKGLNANDALDRLALVPVKGARFIHKVLKSAIANAENNNNLSASKLWIQGVYVDQAITFGRFRPSARGSAHPYKKHTSHIKVVLTEER
ncbi:MAG: 50S ribosomal protein L22 [Verrucomicrobia bacterium CG_4_10_14_3_um_filter_43_23]|nr:MAG: 50S ribosomal protein L22 [Verrucomicrobia bacterium CG1_02_43_26]PIP59610.1 MAG: 50S ribosomal protein L22 [Verrucomicrobia bacterium CG22_combo_CG10-13_8_21_14_all_43_17]PIX58909.1 MAG: 50S ribosomal protein L22 [Verrucomicrobia bacterium CG_4_10_14_3_um_filter_43_23]PIY61685.1 MAG: 50S ribosomal protein L22 [Verrucomicrobia bacterium CG_4_10_14_0_8_um_filter_43_34]PJA44569.1 MAG: 50S ribosomal protein L22 [Verrucomicrobia bacterium CG_4_9_14_3_um_filter_43_20]